MSSFVRSRRPGFGKLLVIAVAGAVSAAAGLHASAATPTWTSASGGNFAADFDWSPAHHPVAGDTANITNAFGGTAYSVALTDSEAAAVINLGAANATLNAQAGGVLTAGTINVSLGELLVAGGTLNGGTVALSSGGTFTFYTGTLNQVTVTGGDIPLSVITPTDITITNGLNLSGHAINAGLLAFTMRFDGASQSLVSATLNCPPFIPSATVLQVGGPASSSAVTLTIDSASVVNGFANIVNNPGIAGNTLINNGAINESAPDSFPSISVDHFTNNGTLSVAPLTTVAITSAQFVNHGRIQLVADASGGMFSGKLSVPNGLSVGDGTLAGDGTITGNVSLQSTANPSTLHFDIGGTTQDKSYDSILMNGNISLGGNLDIAFKSGFQNTIQATDTFTVMTLAAGDTLSGAFLNVPSGGRVSTDDGFGSFLVTYGSGATPNQIVLSNFAAVPEPASAALLLLPLLHSVFRRRRGV